MSVISKEDLTTLSKLAQEYRHASVDHALAKERSYRLTVGPTKLASLDATERDAWERYRTFHNTLLKRLEGEEFTSVVAMVDRPTIYTLEELEDLPEFTVVMEVGNDHGVFLKDFGDRWTASGRSWDASQILLPVTLIYVPEKV